MLFAAAHMAAIGTKRTCQASAAMSAFSNRPFGVKRFQTIHQHSVDVAHGLVLLFGLGAKATIMGFRVPRAFSVRDRNHFVKALFFWCRRNRHAN